MAVALGEGQAAGFDWKYRRLTLLGNVIGVDDGNSAADILCDQGGLAGTIGAGEDPEMGRPRHACRSPLSSK